MVILIVTSLFLFSSIANEFILVSKDFPSNGHIPSIYTCDGKDISPSLSWVNPPPGTQSFVLIIDDPDAPDPDAPKMTWVHWVLYNIPATTTSLEQNTKLLPNGTLVGLNDWEKRGYGGPCPPIGRHRYFHKLYALDIVLAPMKSPPTKKQVEVLIKGHILGKAELIGTYQKNSN
jgi:Raf kinase inhibitor-like YbhB/YbcL family protein